MVKCWVCGGEFEPERERLQQWAESGKPFEPTDWMCPTCEEVQEWYTLEMLEIAEAGYGSVTT